MAAQIVIREANQADGRALAEIERRTPLHLGDAELVLDRGSDYFAAARLMGDATVLIAEVGGLPIGVFCAAPHRGLVGGVERRMLYIHHARILPGAQNKGLGKLFGDYLREKFEGQVDSNYFYISPGNLQSQAFARRAQNRWSVRPTLIDVETHSAGAPLIGRCATAVDAPRIAEMLNAAHAGEEMFPPYTVVSLSARMERAPELYSWENVWLTDSAVVGVWPEGESITTRVTPLNGQPIESRGAAVLDFGYEPGAGGDLVALLRAWCSSLEERGMSSLSLFSSPGARHWDLLRPLGEIRPFDFWTPGIPEPENVADRGVYVDHIYF